MSNRQRMTWAGLNRGAAASPAIPGYGVEDQDHPAHTQDDPGADDYNIGGPSEFGEDVHKPPYGDSGAPALPGYGVEDQDHPGHQGQVGRQGNLMDLVRRKSAKALVLAKATLGKTAAWNEIEDQAFGFMSMDDGALDASIGRLSGDFLGMEDDLMDMGMDDMDMGMGDEMLGMGMGDDMMGMGMGDMDMDMDMGMEDDYDMRLNAMEDEVMAMRFAQLANQNDPDGETLGADGDSAEEVKKEEKATSKSAAARLMVAFDSYDTDKDGFVTAEDWGGSRALFAALDTDKDGIIARHEVQAGCEKLPEALRGNCEKKKEEGAANDAKDDDGDDKKDDAKESGKKAKKKSDDDDGDDIEMDDDAVEATKKAYLTILAKKAEDDDDDDEGDEVEAAKKAYLTALRKAAKKSDDEEESEDEGDDDEGSNKEASDAQFFAASFDPMGLSDGSNLTAADKRAFSEVFGSDDDDDDDDDEGDEVEAGKKAGDDEDEDDEGKEAKKLARLLKPQSRKASSGVRSVGAVSKTAGNKGNEIHELAKLWASDPDVSGSFR